ncbi:TetR/AcrR family transcriptional regulator [Faucicola mancuniensis]|uniref:TetR/AcrR family transcriptional regulator n=1 Tax=Faucicola mancuniensis TaxID=1309795 RepID=UPI00397759FA
MNEQDLRVIKTEQHIEKAFLQLLFAKSYRAITVQDILEIALINRSTFYRHYPSKDALAEKIVNQFKQDYDNFLTERFSLANDSDLDKFLTKFIHFLQQEKHKILALWQIKTENLHLYDDMYQMIKQKYIIFAKSKQGFGNLDYQGHAYASFMLSNLAYTLEHNIVMSLDDIRYEMAMMANTINFQC